MLNKHFTSRTKERLRITDETVLEFKAGIFDIDPYFEINNGRYHILGDIGRFDHGFRTGFFRKAIKYKLSFMVAGSTAKYRFRIKYGEKFKMSTKIIYTDDIWETKANNIGLKKVQTEFATLVQDDMLIRQKNWDKKLLYNFKKSKLFAVSGRAAHDFSFDKKN